LLVASIAHLLIGLQWNQNLSSLPRQFMQICRKDTLSERLQGGLVRVPRCDRHFHSLLREQPGTTGADARPTAHNERNFCLVHPRLPKMVVPPVGVLGGPCIYRVQLPNLIAPAMIKP
jgi:hypothetical protein